MGRQQKKLTKKDRLEIESMAAIGMTQKQIAAIKNICVDILRKNAHTDWLRGKAKSIAALARTAFDMALNQRDRTMLIFLLKTQGGFQEYPMPESLEHLLVPQCKKED